MVVAAASPPSHSVLNLPHDTSAFKSSPPTTIAGTVTVDAAISRTLTKSPTSPTGSLQTPSIHLGSFESYSDKRRSSSPDVETSIATPTLSSVRPPSRPAVSPSHSYSSLSSLVENASLGVNPDVQITSPSPQQLKGEASNQSTESPIKKAEDSETRKLSLSIPARTNGSQLPISNGGSQTGVNGEAREVQRRTPRASPVPPLQPSSSSTLGSLNIHSPTSPLEGSTFSFSLNDEDATPFAARHSTLARSGSAEEPRKGRPATRVLSSLTVRVPSPLTPTRSSFDLESPRLRESPSVRRTIIEANTAQRGASPVTRHTADEQCVVIEEDRSNEFEYDLSPNSPSPAPKRHLNSTTSALAPSRSSTASDKDIDAPRQGVNATALSQDRSLPNTTRPTQEPSHMAAVETIPMPMPIPALTRGSRTSTINTMSSSKNSPRAVSGPLLMASPVAATPPLPSSSRSPGRPPSPERSRSFAAVRTSPTEYPPKSNSMPTPMPFNSGPRHQSTNSASNLPAIAGLADAGPYPTAPPPISGPSGGLAIPGANASGSRNIPPALMRQQEEVCLECMMRDRDLADVDVQGDGVWDRESDIAWNDLRAREQEMMRSWSVDLSQAPGSLDDHSTNSESTSSPRSRESALSDEAQRQALLRKQLRETRRSKRDDRDARIAQVGWRGFKWEEGTNGEGFPRGFRGTKPGALTEAGIKNVLTLYPSSSALRYQFLQTYLRGQYRLILEIRSEAQRTGQYAEPDEPYYPTSPTLSSSDSGPSSGSKPRRLTQRSMDLGAPSIKASSISTARSAPVPPLAMPPSAPTLRPSPSTPAGLGTQVTTRTRPKTYYTDREPLPNQSPTINLANTNVTRTSHYKVPSGSTLPRARESRFYAGDDWSDGEDLWPPSSPASGNLRPFSFAVRAGAGGGQQGSDSGHSRRSFFGRFGGSVTSLFGGSHGGSGSMMDMHLGLESDRRNRTSSYQAHEGPRTGLSPVRPPFGSRQSLASSVYLAGQDEYQQQQQLQAPPPLSPRKERPRSRSVSASRLTQVSLFDDVDEPEPTNKKKGLKGLLQKMKPKGKRDRSSTLVGININPNQRNEEDISITNDLAPPPPMAYLVGSSGREHNRQRSGSSASVGEESTPSLSPQTASGPTGPHGTRSVSAPGPASSGSGSVSPTSSRFQTERREDSTGSSGRRRADSVLELPPGAGEAPIHPQRSSVMEMLTGTSPASMGNSIMTPVTPLYEEPQPLPQSYGRESMMMPNGQQNIQTGFRKSKQPSLSSRYSTSTGTVPAIETPEPGASAGYLLPHQSPPGTGSNRHKNLPPLPPPNVGPDAYYDQDSMSIRGSMYEQKRMSAMPYPRGPGGPPMGPPGYPENPTVHRAGVPPSADYFPTASPRYQPQTQQSLSPTVYMQVPQQGGNRTIQPRASFDYLGGDRSRRGSAMPTLAPKDNRNDRNTNSMYIQRTAAASTGSFGRFLKGQDHNTIINSVPQTQDKKERRRGIKSIFSKAK